MADMKYTAKDSVFSFIFRQPENTRHLYLTLHPEDVDVTEADCKLVTLEHILTNGMTNDLGFQVRDKLILLVEAQSKFSINIALWMLLYLAATYKEYVEEHKLDLYGSKPVFRRTLISTSAPPSPSYISDRRRISGSWRGAPV